MVDRQAHATLELSLSLRNLPQIDYLSKSDPFIAVRYNNNYMARTETIWNNHDPDFLKLIQVQYLFEQTQDIEFHVFDADSNSKDLAKQNFIGSVKTTVADLAAALQGKSKFNIRASDGRIVQGSEGPTLLIVRAEQLKEENHDITLSIKVHDLPSSFALSPSTFLEISRTMDDNSLVCVYRSQTMLRTSSPNFGEIKTSSQKLCNSDFKRSIRLSVWSNPMLSSSPSLIGACNTTLSDLMDHKDNFDINLQKDGKPRGVIQIFSKVAKVHSFLDYISAGCEINLMVAIDFTGSNGDPVDPKSLHYIHPKTLNDYELAIKNVGDILAKYDSDQLYPVWGFGARILATNEISHLFNISWRDDPNVRGVDGILHAYRNSFSKILLSGPTYFSEVIQMAAMSASTHFTDAQQKYSVLLILTDGVINDMSNTVRAIVDASELPLSIIIVGIGDADFEAMNVLDADDNPLSYGNKKMARDIVQFVPFRNFKNANLAALTKEVLEEVPEQFISYCKSRNVQPMKKNAIVDSDFERKKRNHNYNFAPAVPEEKNASPSPPNYQTITELFPPSAIPTVANPQLNASKKPTPPQLQRAGTVRECVVCLEAMADQIILPCMHMVLCSNCAPAVHKTGKCPACRGKIESVKQVF